MMKYSTYTWHLVPALEIAYPASCKTPATCTDVIFPNNQPKSKEPRNEIQLSTNCIILPWPMYMESRVKRGRLGTQPQERQRQDQHAENQAESPQKKTSRMTLPGLTYLIVFFLSHRLFDMACFLLQFFLPYFSMMILPLPLLGQSPAFN